MSLETCWAISKGSLLLAMGFAKCVLSNVLSPKMLALTLVEQHESCSTGLRPATPTQGAYFLNRHLILFHHIFATFAIIS